MNISGIHTDMAKRSQDFDTLQSALQGGNLAGAQSAFAGFLQDVQKTNQTAGSSGLFSPGTAAAKDLQNLGSALKSADLGSAQRAFASLKQDVQLAGQSGNNFIIARSHHPLSHAEIAANGVEAFKSSAAGGSTAPSIGAILNLKA
ncbi:MAG TPA: hypothetical protein VFC44_12415 [Candidatus Saccharimonadales bacterium]|nr:hypothetical protein [Candidatus Saccharimonadales bacterium]